VRIGIASFSNEPGLVCERRRTSNFARSAARRRSIVAADIPINATATSSLSSSSPKRRSVGTNSPSTGASRLPVGAPQDCPAEAQRPNDFQPVQRRPRLARCDDPRLQRLPERLPGVVAVPARRRTTARRGSCSCPPYPPACTASRSPWSPHAADSSKVPSAGPNRPAEAGPAGAPHARIPRRVNDPTHARIFDESTHCVDK